ncbi:MAG: triose-phosphate isomerase [Acidobacteria bacterium]|nr:triose-phosphate isomerase [Acidobacteriota bacterium]
MARTPVLAGNWKMFKTVQQTVQFFDEFKHLVAGAAGREIVLCPPFPALAAASEAVRGTSIQIGAQNLHWEAEGAFTGEVSAGMLLGCGCSHVIIGHSERRQYFGETDATVAKRVDAALAAGLTPIVCVGETLEEREASRTEDVLATQFSGGLGHLSSESFGKILIAYEPVWAIGTGKTATPEMAGDAHAFLRAKAAETFGAEAAAGVRILYGGSVKPNNVKGLMEREDIDGGLVGGASLDPESFAAIVRFDS